MTEKPKTESLKELEAKMRAVANGMERSLFIDEDEMQVQEKIGLESPNYYDAYKLDDWLEERARLLTYPWKDVPTKYKQVFKEWANKAKLDLTKEAIPEHQWKRIFYTLRIDFVAWLLRGGKEAKV